MTFFWKYKIFPRIVIVDCQLSLRDLRVSYGIPLKFIEISCIIDEKPTQAKRAHAPSNPKIVIMRSVLSSRLILGLIIHLISMPKNGGY